MNTLYLRNVITEGPDAGYGYAVEPTFTDPGFDIGITDGTDFLKHLASLPGILVHPSYLENHKVGWMPDDWEMGYEALTVKSGWIETDKETYDLLSESERRKVIIPVKERGFTITDTAPRSSNVEDAGEVPDEFVQKHLKIIKEKMKDNFIHQHIGLMFGNVSTASITHFLETGSINGNFRMALLALIDDVMKWQANLQPATHPTQGEDKREEAPLNDLIEVIESVGIGPHQASKVAVKLIKNYLITIKQ